MKTAEELAEELKQYGALFLAKAVLINWRKEGAPGAYGFCYYEIPGTDHDCVMSSYAPAGKPAYPEQKKV
jgi:hypothetical protein